MDFSHLIEPLALRLVQRGMAAALLVAVLCGVLGALVVVRGLEFLGDALGHAVFPGVVVAYLLGLNLALGGLVAAILTTLGISLASQSRQVRESTAIGILYTVAFALGALLLTNSPSASRGLSELLLGNILAVRPSDLLVTGIAGALVLLLVAALYKELVLVSFDPALARALGRSVALWDGLLLLLLALALAVAFQSVGNLLVLALLLAPAATAQLLTRRLLPMLLLAAALAVIAGVAGLFISYWRAVPSGPTIVLLCGAMFGLALLRRAM